MIRPLALAMALAVLGACTSESSPSTSTVATPITAAAVCAPADDVVDVAYGPDPLQQLDLYRPDGEGCAPVPVVVWVHGGGWQTGDKRHALAPKVALWNDAGWAVASVNYRLTDPEAPEVERVVAPAHNEDVAAAVGWLVDNANETGLDPTRLALLGHSAGAGIVAALAADPIYLDAHGLQPDHLACVAPLDTEAFSITSVMDGGPLLGGVYRDAFGTDPAQWAELSPLTHVGEASVPPLFLVTRGTAARRAIVATFADAVVAADGDVTVVDLPTFTHEDVNKRIGDPTDEDLTPALQSFLAGCLAS